jgi:cardiolipin synthase A/B
LAAPRYFTGNSITLLKNGTDFFPALEAAIDAAQTEVHLETYIFADDTAGQRIAAALRRAAQRNVVVRMVVDGFGSHDFFPPQMVNDLLQSGIEVFIYRTEAFRFSFRRYRLRRMHRKIAMIDGHTAFVGGINIIDDINTPNHTPPRYDYAVKVMGPLVQELRPVVHRLWLLLSWTRARTRMYGTFPNVAPAPPRGTHLAALVIRDNLRHRNDIEEAYLDAIENAREEIIIANAYFFPGLSFRRALIAAAARGVKVKLMLQGRVEYRWLHHATRALYGTLLAGGVEIIEYHKSFMHAKVAVIDGDWATVGSSNIDPFSFMLSREANVIVRDSSFSAQLRHSLMAAMHDGAVPVDLREWKQRPLLERLMAWLAYGSARFILGTLGYPQK